MHKDSSRSGKLGIPGLVLGTKVKPRGEVLCQGTHRQLSQVKPEGSSLRPRRHTCPCAQRRPSTEPPPPPPPTRAKWHQQPLPGGDGLGQRREDRAGGSRRKVPLAPSCVGPSAS